MLKTRNEFLRNCEETDLLNVSWWCFFSDPNPPANHIKVLLIITFFKKQLAFGWIGSYYLLLPPVFSANQTQPTTAVQLIDSTSYLVSFVMLRCCLEFSCAQKQCFGTNTCVLSTSLYFTVIWTGKKLWGKPVHYTHYKKHRTKQETTAKDNASGTQHKGTGEPRASPPSFFPWHSLIFKVLLGVPFQWAPAQRAGAVYPPHITLETASAISAYQSSPQALRPIWLVPQGTLGMPGPSE